MVIYIITAGFILFDFITGLIKAFSKKEYNSSIMREGLFHKAGSILVVVFGALVDYAQGYLDLGVTIPVASSLCVYICLMEIGSIIENVSIINPRIIPDKLQHYFQKLTENKVIKTETEEKEADDPENSHSEKG